MSCERVHGKADVIETTWCSECGEEYAPGLARERARADDLETLRRELAECRHENVESPIEMRGLVWCVDCGSWRKAPALEPINADRPWRSPRLLRVAGRFSS